MKTSSVLLLLGFLLSTGLVSLEAQVTVLRTQAEVNAWDQSLTVLTGEVWIDPSGSPTSINNIDALSNLTSIEGTLRISNNQNLKQINGLRNIASITGSLLITQTGIENIDALSKLTTLEGDLTVHSPGSSMADVEGLRNLTEINGNLRLSQFYTLPNIDGLREVSKINGSLTISSNVHLNNIDALSKLTTLDGLLHIGLNRELVSIEGLSNLTEIGPNGELEILPNQFLANLDGLRNLRSVAGVLDIQSIEGVTTLAPLSNLTSIEGTVSLCAMRNLADLDGLTGLTTIEGHLYLKTGFFTTMSGLGNVDTIRGALTIESSLNLPNLDGLSNLESLEGDLTLDFNPQLRNIEGLSKLTCLPGKIDIKRNNLLDNLDGFRSVTSLTGDMNIDNNEVLRNIDGLSLIDSIPGNLVLLRNGIQNIDGLTNIRIITGGIKIHDNENLTNLDGLIGLSRIDGALEITDNFEIRDVDGLINLTSIDGILLIRNNDGLENLNGLRNLDSVEGGLSIGANGRLSDCCGLTEILSFGNNNVFFAIGNAVGCGSKEQVLASTDCDLNNFEALVFIDVNDNCIRDPEESGMENIVINIGDRLKKTTNSLGISRAYLKPAEYQITPEIRTDLFSTCQNDYIVEIGEDEVSLDIPVSIHTHCADLSLGMSVPFLRRCFDNNYTIEVSNNGSAAAENLLLLIELDEYFEYVESNMTLLNMDGQRLIFVLEDGIEAGETKRYKLIVNVSCEANLGQPHYMKGELVYENPCDMRLRDQTTFECRTNIGSFDPNDKTLFVDGFANREIINRDAQVEYLIRFQNTGTDTAFTVRIEDDLVPALSQRSLFPFAASHAYSWSIEKDRLIVLFENINLVDSTTNEPDSHGFVKFRTQIEESEIQAADLVQNKAGIFFDFNRPIITNTTSAFYLCQNTEGDFEPVTICAGDSYLWEADGEEYSDSGFYTTTLSSEMGCDSIVKLRLLVTTNTGEDEIPYNGINDDCNPLTPDDDLDGDGFLLAEDCDDNNPFVHPNQTEGPYNGIDDDCNPATPDDDLDQDGFVLAEDCDDTNALVNPNQLEVPYNGLDDDCKPATMDDDLDGDGYVLSDDCDDTNQAINPAALEIVYNGIDEDCNSGTLDDDLDQDGFPIAEDCDDTNPNINPNAEDLPDNDIDENCDGLDVTAVFELGNATINIYPNPAREFINIEVSEGLSYQIKLYKLDGSLMTTANNSPRLSLENITSGIYLIEVKDLNTGQRVVDRVLVTR